MADSTAQIAAIDQKLDPGGQNPSEQGFIQGENEGYLANNANGLMAGFKFPPNMTPGDLTNLTSAMESFAADTGYKYMPNSTEVMNAWKSGGSQDQESLNKIWAKNAPPQFGYMKYGYTATTFSQYKDQNKQAIQARYGVHADTNDLNYINNMANPLTSLTSASSAGAIGQGSNALKQVGAVR